MNTSSILLFGSAGASRLVRLLCEEVRRNITSGGRPRVPAGGDLLWSWFCDLHACRRSGFSGPEPISIEAIAAYAQAYDWPLAPRHIAAIQAMDDAFLRTASQPASGASASANPVSDRPLSVGMFDAWFG